MTNLLPPKNLRRVRRRACSNCRHWKKIWGEDPYYGKNYHSHYACDRPAGPEGEWGDSVPEFLVCDRHAWQKETQ